MLLRRLLSSTNVAALMVSAGGGGTVPVFSENYLTSSTSALTLSRAGQAMMYDSTGKLTYAPNNILTYSNTFSNAAWTKTNVTVTGGQTDPLSGSNASTLTAGAANATCVQTTAAFTSNGQNTLWIKRKTGSGTIELSKPDGTYTTVSITSSWAQYTANYQGASATGAFNIRIVTSGDEIYVYSAGQAQVTYETSARSVDDVITTSAAYYGPRFEYNPATTTRAGWLIEVEARTNLYLQSNNLSSASWSKLNATIGSDATLGLDGLTAGKITASAATGICAVYQGLSLSNGTTYAHTWYVKAGTHNYVNLVLNSTNANNHIAAVFDLSNTSNTSATQTSVGSTSGTIAATIADYLGNGWWALTVVGSYNNLLNPLAVIELAPAATGNTFNAWGDVSSTWAGTETVYHTISQIEAGSFPSSPIYTTSASVTRAAESVSATTATVGYTAATGTLIIEADAPAVDQQAVIGGFNSSGSSNAILLYKSNAAINAAGAYATAYENDGTATALDSTVSINSGSNYRTGMRWNTSGGATGFAISVNGGSPVAGTVRTPTPTTFRLAMRDDGYPLMGHIRSVANYDATLGDTEFQQKTTVGAAY